MDAKVQKIDVIGRAIKIFSSYYLHFSNFPYLGSHALFIFSFLIWETDCPHYHIHRV